MTERNFSFSIFFTLLGLGVGTGLLFTGVLTSPQRLQFLYQPRGLGVLFGGLSLCFFIGLSSSTRRHLSTLFWDLLTDSAEPNKQGAFNECVMLATRTREAQGQELKLYREIKPYLQHETLRLGLDFLIAAYPEDLIKETLAHHREKRLLIYRQCAEAAQFLGRASLGLGVGAAAMGALRAHLMLSPDTLSFYMAGIGLPLGLGCILYAVVFLPLQQKMRYLEADWARYENLNMMGILLLQGRHHSHYVETILRAYLPHEAQSKRPVRPTSVPAAQASPAAVPPISSPANESSYAQDALEVNGQTLASDLSSGDFRSALASETETGEALNRQQLSRFRPVKRNLPPP